LCLQKEIPSRPRLLTAKLVQLDFGIELLASTIERFNEPSFGKVVFLSISQSKLSRNNKYRKTKQPDRLLRLIKILTLF
jgi:hypothetical protein